MLVNVKNFELKIIYIIFYRKKNYLGKGFNELVLFLFF